MKTFNSMSDKSVKILSVFLFISVFIGLFSACKKDETDSLTGELGFVSWPQKWVFASDFDESTYRYIYSIGSGILYKGKVEKSYSINDLIDEKDCQFEVNPLTGSGMDKLYTIRSAQNADHWWGVFRTYTPFGDEQWYLGLDEEDELPAGDQYRFILHAMPKADGLNTYAIESHLRRGQYLDYAGHNFSGNGLSFIAYDKPEEAPRFKVLFPKGYGYGK